MRCPFCGGDDTRVLDSRLGDDGESVRRRRLCQRCEERFTTYERPQLSLPRIVKRDGHRESFDEAKLRAGMNRALEKRPVGTDAIEAALGRILKQLRETGSAEIDAGQVGECVMQALYDLDDVAYVRFASVYRRFQDLDAFIDELDKLKRRPSAEVKRLQLTFLPKEDKKQ